MAPDGQLGRPKRGGDGGAHGDDADVAGPGGGGGRDDSDEDRPLEQGGRDDVEGWAVEARSERDDRNGLGRDSDDGLGDVMHVGVGPEVRLVKWPWE